MGSHSITGIAGAVVIDCCLALSVNLTKRVSVLQQPIFPFLPHLQAALGNIESDTLLILPLQ